MAFEIIEQPNDLPKTSDDYKLQNQNIQATFIGMDKTVIKDNGNGTVTLLISGAVDCGGILYTNNSEVVLTPTLGSSLLKIKLVPSIDNLTVTPVLTDEEVFFSSDRYGYYTANGERVLNTFLFVNGTNITLLDTNKEIAITTLPNLVKEYNTVYPIGYEYAENFTFYNDLSTLYSSNSWINNSNLVIPKTGNYRIGIGGFVKFEKGSLGQLGGANVRGITILHVGNSQLIPIFTNTYKTDSVTCNIDNPISNIINANAGDKINLSINIFVEGVGQVIANIKCTYNFNIFIKEL